MNTKEALHIIENLSGEMITMREKFEIYRNILKQLTMEVKALDKEMKKYSTAEEKGLLVILPVPLGSMTYQVVPDTKDPSGKTYKYTQHVFEWDDMNEFGKTVFTSDTEAMVVAIDMTKKNKKED